MLALFLSYLFFSDRFEDTGNPRFLPGICWSLSTPFSVLPLFFYSLLLFLVLVLYGNFPLCDNTVFLISPASGLSYWYYALDVTDLVMASSRDKLTGIYSSQDHDLLLMIYLLILYPFLDLTNHFHDDHTFPIFFSVGINIQLPFSVPCSFFLIWLGFILNMSMFCSLYYCSWSRRKAWFVYILNIFFSSAVWTQSPELTWSIFSSL